MGRRPLGARASTAAERQAHYRRRQTADRVKALARKAMIEQDLDNLIRRYGESEVRKALKARTRRGRQPSRRATGHLIEEAEAELENRRLVRNGLLAAYYRLGLIVAKIVMRAHVYDEASARLTGLLDVLSKGVYTLADALIDIDALLHEDLRTVGKPYADAERSVTK